MKNNPKKKKDFSVLIPVIIVALLLAFIVGGLIYNAVTGGPEPVAEAYLEWMMERDGAQMVNGYHPSILTYASKTTGEKTSAIAQRVQSRIDTWYDGKILSGCGVVSSYETELLSVEDAGEDAIRDLEVMTGLEVSDAVICKGRITARGDKGETTSDQTVYLMKIDDAWYLYGLGLLV
jgi:hypothetical protein